MRHSLFDFILDLKNIQTIYTRKTQDNYAIIQKWFDLNFVFVLFFMNVLVFCYKGNKLAILKQILVFVFCLLRKNIFLFKMSTLRIEKKKNYFVDRPFFLSCPWTNILNWFRLIPPERRVIYYLICPKYFSYHDKIFHTNISALQNYKNRENLVKSCRVK